jgi:hypothetical protein
MFVLRNPAIKIKEIRPIRTCKCAYSTAHPTKKVHAAQIGTGKSNI